MGANIHHSSGLAIAAAHLIHEWQNKVQPKVIREEAQVSSSTDNDTDEKSETLNQKLLEMADDMAHIATQFRSQRKLDKKNQDVADNFERVLEEDTVPKAKKLVEVIAIEKSSLDSLMAQARKLFPDDSDLYLVIKEILSRKKLSVLQRRRLDRMQQELIQQADPKMLKGGINCGLKARLFSSTIGLKASLLRATYRRFLENESKPLEYYEEWISSYGYKLRHTVLDFIEESLSIDIRSEDPSCNQHEFGNLIGQMQKIKVLRTADQEFVMSLLGKKLVTPYLDEEADWLLLLCSLVSQEVAPEMVLKKILCDSFLESYTEKSVFISAIRIAYKRLPDSLFDEDYDKEIVSKAFDLLLDQSYSAELLSQRIHKK